MVIKTSTERVKKSRDLALKNHGRMRKEFMITEKENVALKAHLQKIRNKSK